MDIINIEFNVKRYYILTTSFRKVLFMMFFCIMDYKTVLKAVCI